MINSVNKTNKKCPNNTMQYVVKSGDTLYKIATRNKTSIEVLLELNPELNTNLLIPGIVMCVPTNVAVPPIAPPGGKPVCPDNNPPTMPPSGMPVPPIAPPGGMPIPPTMPPSGMPVPPIAPPGGMPIPPTRPPSGVPVPPIAPPGGMPIPPTRPPSGVPVPPIAPPGGMPIPPTRPPSGVPVPPIAPPGGMPIPPIMPPSGVPVPPIAPPGGMPIPPIMPPTEVECKGQMKYTIKHGDTLYNLAKKYDITLYELLNANKNINPYNLQVGQIICIPMSTTKCPYGKVYTVATGDTLSSILTKFRISLATLKEVNENFDPYNIKAGTKLCIPAFMAFDNCPTERTYVISSGDNLTRISENFMISTSDLLAFNPNMRPEDFADVGVKICLPAEGVPFR